VSGGINDVDTARKRAKECDAKARPLAVKLLIRPHK
jgi:hypothetical protein